MAQPPLPPDQGLPDSRVATPEVPKVSSARSNTSHRSGPGLHPPLSVGLIRSASQGSLRSDIESGPSPEGGIRRSRSTSGISKSASGRTTSKEHLLPLDYSPTLPVTGNPLVDDPCDKPSGVPRLAPLSTVGGSSPVRRPSSRSGSSIPPLNPSGSDVGRVSDNGGDPLDPARDHDQNQGTGVPLPPQPPATTEEAAAMIAKKRKNVPPLVAPVPGQETDADAATARGPVKWVPHTHTNPKHAKFCFICLHGKLEGHADGVEDEVRKQQTLDQDLPNPVDLKELGYLMPNGTDFRRIEADYGKDNISAMWLRGVNDRVYTEAVKGMVAEQNWALCQGLDERLQDHEEDAKDRETLMRIFTLSDEQMTGVERRLQKLGGWCTAQEARLLDVMPKPRPRDDMPEVPSPTPLQNGMLDYHPLMDGSSFKGDSALDAKDALTMAEAVFLRNGSKGYDGFKADELPRPATAPDMPQVEVVPYPLCVDDLPNYVPMEPSKPKRWPLGANPDPFERPFLHLEHFHELTMPEFTSTASWGEPRAVFPQAAPSEWLYKCHSIFAQVSSDGGRGLDVDWGMDAERGRYMVPLIDEPYLPQPDVVQARDGSKKLVFRGIWDPEIVIGKGKTVPPLRDRGRALYRPIPYEHPDEPRWSRCLAPPKTRSNKIKDMINIIPVKSFSKFKPNRVSVDLPEFLWDIVSQDAAGQGLWDVISQRHDVARSVKEEREATDNEFHLTDVTNRGDEHLQSEEVNRMDSAVVDPSSSLGNAEDPSPQDGNGGEGGAVAGGDTIPDDSEAPVASAAGGIGTDAAEVSTPQGSTAAPPVQDASERPLGADEKPDVEDENATNGPNGQSQRDKMQITVDIPCAAPSESSGAVLTPVPKVLSQMFADEKFINSVADKIVARLGGVVTMPGVPSPLSARSTAGLDKWRETLSGGMTTLTGAQTSTTVRPDPPSFAEPEDEKSRAKLPRALMGSNGAKSGAEADGKLKQKTAVTTTSDVQHFTQEKMRGECYVRLLVAPEEHLARKEAIPYRGNTCDPDMTLVTGGASRVNTTMPKKPAYLNEDGEWEEDDDFAEFERNDSVIFSFVRHNRFEAVESLIAQEADALLSKDTNGNGLLHIACQNNNRRVVKLLIKSGISVNEQNHKGNTPLHYCSQYGFMQLGDYLLAHGADDTIQNENGALAPQGFGNDSATKK